ncbi:hypothetical protein I79_026097 [Cricetulus griseus]|uniref:Uncharacterized protein n=1 Tax=Cricetulus griseus TaxID=10029 RepID=G3IQ12_CRIGR|nr:hypothetical protein I79_026097 [Cricetulus griseus]
MSSCTYKDTFMDIHVMFTFECQQLKKPQVYQQLNGYTNYYHTKTRILLSNKEATIDI